MLTNLHFQSGIQLTILDRAKREREREKLENFRRAVPEGGRKREGERT